MGFIFQNLKTNFLRIDFGLNDRGLPRKISSVDTKLPRYISYVSDICFATFLGKRTSNMFFFHRKPH